jgi:hypothetical protein
MRLCLLLGVLFFAGGLLGVLFFATGCASAGGKDQWADFWKDLRGDNMEMRGFNDQSDSTKDR